MGPGFVLISPAMSSRNASSVHDLVWSVWWKRWEWREQTDSERIGLGEREGDNDGEIDQLIIAPRRTGRYSPDLDGNDLI